jgi:hypothetical protein
MEEMLMKKTLLATVAVAALIAGPALAQRQEAPAGDVKGAAPPPAAIQKAPAEKMAPKASGGADIKADSKAQTTGQAAPKAETKSGSEMKAGSDTKSGADTKSRMDADTKSRASGAADSKDKAAAQQGQAKALTTEQKSKIRTTVLTQNAPRVTNVNFSIRVGTVVPRSVRLVAVPAPIIEVYPAYRGFLYFVHGDEIIIVEPGTLRIVTVITV